GVINTKAKNDSVLLGVPRILETLRRARANYLSGFNIPKPPYPPASFTVGGGGDKIALSWDPNPIESANGFAGYRVYRATGRPDSTYRLIFQSGGDRPSDPNVAYVSNAKTYSFDDLSAVRGISYYYYIASFGNSIPADPATRTPAGELESSRFFTQTYDPAFLKRPAGTSSDQIRIAPNPYIISSNENVLRFPNEGDKIAFFNIPGNCVIKIFTELGELIKEIVHDDGTGDAYWNSVTSSNQVVVSGIYLVVIENRETGERIIKKLVIIR
ncbi:MAG: fibronectin, partial [Bacteroidota bacterium]